MAARFVVVHDGKAIGVYSDEQTARNVANDINSAARGIDAGYTVLNALHVTPEQVDAAERMTRHTFGYAASPR